MTIILIHYRFTGSCKDQSTKLCQTGNAHTGRTQSFARLRDELKKQDPEGNEPDKITIFKATHTRKKDKPIDPNVANTMRQMDELVTNQPDASKNEIFNQVMGEVIGPKADVSTLTYGLGITR
ncbi:hypothetical protein Dsin_018382 [Dipteronia sinensis]|uniref:Uncharacterized protein n=1 Tax=Dipteronia sinensis TaxID=43782 RepID=A0AAE0A5E0_9ROSI|nr:hypothetical protein Dsin_018382 [Dipteronia sinensis]